MSFSNYNNDDFQNWNYQNMYGHNVEESFGASSQTHLFGHHAQPHSHSLPEIDIEAAVKGESKLGLKLTKTPSLLNIVDGFKTSRGKGKQSEDDKLKAANFPALSIQIGSWKRESRHEGDLVAKSYFKKRKLVWEFLEGNLKTKIEFLWSNILAIRQRTCLANKTRILEVLLERSPLFFREVNPQPRKHTNWEQTNDFTNNQASLNRKHILEFSPGVLEKHFDKIIQADSKLHRLSQQAWPNHITPYFHEIRFSNEIPFNHSPSFTTTFAPQIPTHIQAMNSELMNGSDFYPTTNYPIQDTSYNQNVSPYQNLELGELSINGNDNYNNDHYSQGFPNTIDHQSEFYTSTNDFSDANQNVSYGHEQELSYENSFPYSVANSDTYDVGNYQSNYDYQSQYYNNDVGGNQWQ